VTFFFGRITYSTAHISKVQASRSPQWRGSGKIMESRYEKLIPTNLDRFYAREEARKALCLGAEKAGHCFSFMPIDGLADTTEYTSRLLLETAR